MFKIGLSVYKCVQNRFIDVLIVHIVICIIKSIPKEDKSMKKLIFKNDNYNMNWIEGAVEWGTVKVPDGIKVAVSSEEQDDIVCECYTFTNTTSKDIFTSLKDIAIYTPFNDDYKDSQTCVTNRCHTHIWCGGD